MDSSDLDQLSAELGLIGANPAPIVLSYFTATKRLHVVTFDWRHATYIWADCGSTFGRNNRSAFSPQ